MAKASRKKPNKAGHPFIGTAGGLNYYINDGGEITDEDGKHVGTGYQKVLLQQFSPPESAEQKEPAETLEQAFPETYKEPRTKKRTARKRNEDVEKREAAEKEAADLKRDVEDLRQQLNGISTLMREDTALIKQQLSTQQKSITLLTEISKHIKGGGGGSSIGGGFGWKGMLAAMLGAGALGAAGGYFLNNMLSDDDEEEDKPDVTTPPPEAPPQQSTAIQQAEQRGEQKTENLIINATQLTFNSDKLRFEVNDLTIDANKINGGGPSATPVSGGGGGGGGGGPNGPTGTAGGGPAAGPAGGAFNPNTETPSSPSGTPGQSIAGGKGAYQGFTGKAPTTESVKEDVEKAGTFQPGSFAATPKNGIYDAAAAAALIKQEGGTDEEARILGAIAYSESRGRPDAHNPNAATGDDSYGLWQINMLGRMGPERMKLLGITDPNQLKDPAINAKAALMLLRGKLGGAGGYQHWSDYKNGKYRQFVDQAGQGLKSKVVESTTSPAEIMPYQSTGDLFNPNPTTSTAASLQPVPFEKTPIVSANDPAAFAKLDFVDNRPTNAERSTQANALTEQDARIAAMQKQSDEAKNNSIPAGERFKPDRSNPYASWSSGDERAAKVAYVNTPAETLGTFRATYPEENAMAPKPEAPAPTAEAITPQPEPPTPQSPTGGAQLGSYDAINKPSAWGDTKFGIDGPEGDVAAFKTTRPHKAFLYLTPDMKIPNLSMGGQ